MREPVKPGTGRRERNAQLTRGRLLDAAEALFIRDGYTAATIAAIAEAADVAVQTVYAVFGNKRAILIELLAIRAVGDDAGGPLRNADEWRAMEAEVDPRRQLALFAAAATRIGQRMADLYEVLAGAASSDPEIATVLRTQQAKRYQDQRRVVRSLAHRGALRPDVSETRATDILWAIANPTTYRMLVNGRRWSAGDYERWLADLLASELLR